MHIPNFTPYQGSLYWNILKRFFTSGSYGLFAYLSLNMKPCCNCSFQFTSIPYVRTFLGTIQELGFVPTSAGWTVVHGFCGGWTFPDLSYIVTLDCFTVLLSCWPVVRKSARCICSKLISFGISFGVLFNKSEKWKKGKQFLLHERQIYLHFWLIWMVGSILDLERESCRLSS